MRVILRLLGLSAVAMAAVAPATSLAAQGRGKGHQEARAQDPRSRGKDAGRGEAKGKDVRGDSRVQVAALPEVRFGGNGQRAQPAQQGRGRPQSPPVVVQRRGDDPRGRGDDRWRDNRGRDDRGRDNARWRPDDRWRGDHVRVIREYYAVPRHYYVPRFAYARLPYGWSSRVYLYGFFPYEYDYYVEPLPEGLAYVLPPLYPGYDRFIFGGRIVVMDHFTRSIVFMVSL